MLEAVGPRLLAGRFEVEAVAASGAMGVVHRCRDRATGERVAVKVMPHTMASLRERFFREAEMLSTVAHPGIVRYLDHGLLEGGEPYMAMEWLDGEDLEARLARAPLDLPASIALGRSLAAALAAAHAAGIVHRDVKPANVFLVGGDPATPKLLDFGLARASERDDGRPGTVMGTPGYMAPEQARGEPHIDARADVFSLGCVLYECAGGRRAFDGDSPMAILAKVLLEEPPRLRTLRPALPLVVDHAVSRMLAKSKDARYPSATEVLRDLDRVDTASEERLAMSLAPQSLVPQSLTTRERRILCLLLARNGPAPEKDATLVDGVDAPLGMADAARAAAELRQLLGTPPEVLLDGSLVAVVEGAAAADQAACAARAALRLRELAHGTSLRIAVATGRGEVTGTLPFGEVVDRACALLDAPAADEGVRVDALTSNLVEARFAVTTDALGPVLLRELEAESVRSLLGRATSCVGRERELEALVRVYEDVCQARSPRLALLTGEAGIGKSRVRAELATRLQGANALWLYGGGDVASPGAPFGALQSALRRELGLRPEHDVATRRAALAARLARTLDPTAAESLAPRLAQLAGLPLDDVGPGESARVDAMLQGDALRAAWQDFLEAEARAKPVVLVLEDMQWGDRPTVTFTVAALRALSASPLFVLLVGRPEVVGTFPELRDARGILQIELDPLEPEASTMLLGQLLEDLPTAADAATLARVAEQAAGNPFLLEELARAVAAGRGAELPESVVAIAQARLGALSPELRLVLRAAALLGDALTEAGLAALLVDLAPASIRAHLSALVREEVLEFDPHDHGRYRFRQAVLREASYASLTEADKTLAHELAARWLYARGGADPLALATHLERAGRPAEACVHYLDAAEQSLEGSDLDGAAARLDRASASEPQGATLGRLLLLRSDAQHWRGQSREVRENASRAAALLPERSPLWLAAKVNEAIASALLADLAPAEALAAQLIPWIERAPTPGVLAVAGRTSAVLSRYRVGSNVAKGLVAALSAALTECTDDRALGWIYNALATDAQARSDLEDAIDFGRSYDAYLFRAGDLRNACNARINNGYALVLLGQYARAETAFREGLAIADRAGFVALSALAHHNLGPVLAHGGDLDGAEAHEREAVRAYSAQANKRILAGSRYYLGRILLARGRVEEAEAELHAAVDDAKGVDALVPLLRAGVAFALRAGGKLDAAIACARESMRMAAERGWRVEQPLTIKLALAEALAAGGVESEARALVAEATFQLFEQAGRLRDPELKRSFLHEVDDHARLFALQGSLGGAGA